MIRVGVLRGGMSDEFEVSIKTGSNIINSLPKDKYKPVDILITKDGTWHIGGVPMELTDIKINIDVAFNALHGEYGEDGKVSRILEEHGIPYTGSEAVPSSLAINKHMAKEVFKRAGMKTPPGMMIEDYRDSTIVGEIHQKIEELAHRIFRSIPPPWVLKPARGGSSINTFIAKNFHELVESLTKLFSYGGDLVVEQYIKGKEATVGVVRGFRNEKYYPLMPIEIRPRNRSFFDYDAKYKGESDEIVPGSFSRAEKEELERLAVLAHTALGLNDYSRSDFIVTPSGAIYILEINNLPRLTKESLISKALEAAGSSTSELADHLITLALEGK